MPNKVKELMKEHPLLIEVLVKEIQSQANASLTAITKETIDQDWSLRVAELRGKYLAYTKVTDFLQGKI